VVCSDAAIPLVKWLHKSDGQSLGGCNKVRDVHPLGWLHTSVGQVPCLVAALSSRTVASSGVCQISLGGHPLVGLMHKGPAPSMHPWVLPKTPRAHPLVAA
jgi:hypothetical protein